MALKQDLPDIVDFIKGNRSILDKNKVLFDISEGDLLTYVLEALRRQLSEQSYEAAKDRVAPINLLRRVVDKLSKIYSKPPQRTLTIDSSSDQKLFDFYMNEMDPNTNFNMSNEFFNTYKNVAVEAFIQNETPKIRVVPADRFLFYSNDPIDPTNPTHYIKFMGKVKKEGENEQEVIAVYTKEEAKLVNEKGEAHLDLMADRDMDGTNPLDALPAIHFNQSKHLIVPKFDADMLAMTLLLPILLTDLNYAVMFQAFSIIYGIDVDSKDLKMAPNSFWSFKSDTETEKQPQVNQIKPQVDINEVIGMIQAQLSIWLNSKGIRPGSVGQLTAENMVSGLSKIVDEMDTFEARQKQVPEFTDGEERFWFLLMHHYHPWWVRTGRLRSGLFSPRQEIKVEFAEQKPIQPRAEIIKEVREEISAGFTTKRRALQRVNPDMSEEEIEELLVEIEGERTVRIPDMSEPEDDNGEVATDQDQDT